MDIVDAQAACLNYFVDGDEPNKMFPSDQGEKKPITSRT
jgi:hypothetical protein